MGPKSARKSNLNKGRNSKKAYAKSLQREYARKEMFKLADKVEREIKEWQRSMKSQQRAKSYDGPALVSIELIGIKFFAAKSLTLKFTFDNFSISIPFEVVETQKHQFHRKAKTLSRIMKAVQNGRKSINIKNFMAKFASITK
jgi:hypothetical protein